MDKALEEAKKKCPRTLDLIVTGMNSFRDYDKRIARMNKCFPVKPIDILFDFGRIEGGLFSKKVMQVAYTDTQFCIINEEFKLWEFSIAEKCLKTVGFFALSKKIYIRLCVYNHPKK